MCATVGFARAQSAAEAPQSADPADADGKSDTGADKLVASNTPPDIAGERDYIVQAPAVHRPSACQPELQTLFRLAGTVYDARHPERSMAMLGPASTPATAVYRAGSRFGAFEVLEVRTHAVLLSLDREESPCWLKMTRPTPNAPPPTAAAAAPPTEKKKARGKAFSPEELAQGIQQIGPGTYRVHRTLLERAIALAPKLARSTRTKTVKRQGVPVGMSLRAIESGGLFEHLGLKKGDVVKTVNGFDMSSIDGMLSARTQLSAAPSLSLALSRGGQPVTLEYRVQ